MIKRIGSLTLALVAAIGSGCVQGNMGSVEIVGVCSLPDSCSFSGSCTERILSRPIIDVSLTNTLQLYLELHNQLENNADFSAGRVNTHDAYVEEVSVGYESITGAISLAGGSMHTIGTVGTLNTAVVKMYIVPEAVGTALQAAAIPAFDAAAQNYVDMVAHVTVSGSLVDTSRFETSAYEIPFRVCRGCLTTCTATCPPGNAGQLPRICATTP